MNILINAVLFFRFQTHTGGRNGVAQKISIRGPQPGLRAGELEVMLAQAFEERPHCLDVSCWVGPEDYHIVEVGCHLFQALYNLVQNPDDTPARSAAALWHDEPLTEARVSVKRRERSGILVRGILMK